MALLNEIKLRTRSIIRKNISNQQYLIWANEALEQLSEVAKIEVDPILPKLNNGNYSYLILNDGTHLFKYSETTYTTEEIIYYNEAGEEVAVYWEDSDILYSASVPFTNDESLIVEKLAQVNNLSKNSNFNRGTNYWSLDFSTNYLILADSVKAYKTATDNVPIYMFNHSYLSSPVGAGFTVPDISVGDILFYKVKLKTSLDYNSNTMSLVFSLGYYNSETNIQIGIDFVELGYGTGVNIEPDTWYTYYGTHEVVAGDISSYPNVDTSYYTIQIIAEYTGSTNTAINEYVEIDREDSWIVMNTKNTDYEYLSAEEINTLINSESNTSLYKKIIETNETVYNYTYTGENEYEEYTEYISEDDIKFNLQITNETVELPNNFQQIIKITGLIGDQLYKFNERGFGDNEITSYGNYPNSARITNQNHLFYFSREESKLTFKSPLLSSGKTIDFEINYYAHLPQYNIETDVNNWDQLTVPLEPTYHNLINYYCIYKYYESWQNKDLANDYYTKYLKLKAEYAESVQRKHEENMGTEADVVIPFY